MGHQEFKWKHGLSGLVSEMNGEKNSSEKLERVDKFQNCMEQKTLKWKPTRVGKTIWDRNIDKVSVGSLQKTEWKPEVQNAKWVSVTSAEEFLKVINN